QTSGGIRGELGRCQDAIAAATGAEPPRWMRPPYGYRNPLLRREIRRVGIESVVMWSKICWDWKPQQPQRLIERLASVTRAGRKRGDIVVMHDGDHRALGGDRLHVVAALEYWLPRWRDAGVEFVTMESSSAVDVHT
ncbi:MAG TPA: polysaccharide deacetylase family protein, partial [Candidatus Acidoferrales bacterium]|nr:polysaccharide deacetylase family protein [Candidatus Acidoferrales bacterium]